MINKVLMLSVGMMFFISFPVLSLASDATNINSFLNEICLGDKQKVLLCEDDRKTFVDDYHNAFKGDYGAQRNFAYCMRTGCKGATIQNSIIACAWRKVILASAHIKLQPTDQNHHSIDCKNLNKIEHENANIIADGFFAQTPQGEERVIPFSIKKQPH